MVCWVRKILGFVGLFKARKGDEREEPPRSLLLELPLEILRLIIPYLSLVHRACLALTCKPLYRLLHSVHDDEQLAWPRYLASPIPAREPFGSQPHLPRNDLLFRLEDARWLYCRDCLKLHPKDYFFEKFIEYPPSDRYCKNMTGVVDLCACLALTYTDGIRLVEWIQTGVPSQYLHRNIRQEFQFRVLGNRQTLIHRCSVTSQPDVFVTLTATAALGADNRLIFTTRYNVYLSTPHRHIGDAVRDYEPYQPPPNVESIFLCPHSHALAGLYGRYAPAEVHEDMCNSCRTKYCLLRYTADGLHSVIQAERDLGTMHHDPQKIMVQRDCSWAWSKSSRNPGNQMEKLWYRKPYYLARLAGYSTI